MKVQMKLKDAFSGCSNTIARDVTKDQFDKLSKVAGIGVTVWNQFDGGINFTWELESIKIIQT